MSEVRNGKSELVMVEGTGVSYEQARRALLMSIQAVAEERDERFDLIEEARLLRLKINRFADSLFADLSSSNVVSLPVGSGQYQSALKALKIAFESAQTAPEGYVPISASIHWMETAKNNAKMRARFILQSDGSIKLLRSKTIIFEGSAQEPGRLERSEWISRKTLDGLIPFIERGFDFEVFLDEVLGSVER